jgi:transposase
MSLNESGRHSREFMLKAVERLEAGECASALAIELNLNRTIIYHWRDRFRANGAEALTSKRGRPRTPEVLAAESVRVSRARADGLVQARAQIAELERKVALSTCLAVIATRPMVALNTLTAMMLRQRR